MKELWVSFFLLVLPLSAHANADTGRCVGMPQSCEFFGPGACQIQVGCNVDMVSHSCTGMAWACYMFSTPGSCSQQRGCSWQPQAESER